MKVFSFQTFRPLFIFPSLFLREDFAVPYERDMSRDVSGESTVNNGEKMVYYIMSFWPKGLEAEPLGTQVGFCITGRVMHSYLQSPIHSHSFTECLLYSKCWWMKENKDYHSLSTYRVQCALNRVFYFILARTQRYKNYSFFCEETEAQREVNLPQITRQ